MNAGRMLAFATVIVLTVPYMLTSECDAARPVVKRAVRRGRNGVGNVYKAKQRKKAYKYISEHDLNGDGKVDSKDRLILLNRGKKDNVLVVLDSENEDLYGEMDMNGDGQVSGGEMKAFLGAYDRNGDGNIDEFELEKATD